MIKPRPYQDTLAGDIRDAFRQYKRILAVSPTGSGKRILLALMAKVAAERGFRTMVTVHRIELLDQTIETFHEVGIEHGVIAAGFKENFEPLVQVASIDSLRRRLDRVPPPNLLVPDEAHHVPAKTHALVVERYPNAFIVGWTATPERLDRRGLGRWFDKIVLGPSLRWLIDNGYLSDYIAFGAVPVDLKGVKTVAGDFDKKRLQQIMDTPTITGNVIAEYMKHCAGKRALVFAVSLEHSRHLVDAFWKVGIPAQHVDGETPKVERRRAISDFRADEVKVLSNVGLFGEGLDIPGAEAVIDVNPTKSLGAYLQRFGRGTRPVYAPGMPIETPEQRVAAIAAGPKPHMIYLDHAGNIMRHGMPDEEREWSLADKVKKRRKGESTPIRTCPKCFFIHKPAPECPKCGHVYDKVAREVQQVEGELQRIKKEEVEALRAKKKVENKHAKTEEELVELGRSRQYRYPELWAKRFQQMRENRGGWKKK